MSITAAELKTYGSANMPEDDTSTSGGAIDTATKVEFTDISAPDTVNLVSSAAGDTTQLVTITGRDNTGAIVSGSATLNGTTPVTVTPGGAGTFERILKIVMGATAVGTVTATKTTGGATIATLEPGITKVRRLFYDSFSTASPTTRYEKIFWKNTDGSLTLTNAVIQLFADPSSKLLLGLATAKNDSGSVANRLTAPGGVTFVGVGVNQSVPGTTLEAGAVIGTWIELSLLANDSPLKSTGTTQLQGNSV